MQSLLTQKPECPTSKETALHQKGGGTENKFKEGLARFPVPPMWWQILKVMCIWLDSKVFKVPAKKVQKSGGPSLCIFIRICKATSSYRLIKMRFSGLWEICLLDYVMLQSVETNYQIEELMGQLVLEAGHSKMSKISLLWIKTYGGHNLCTSLPSVQWWIAMNLTKVRLISLDSCWSPRQSMLSICSSLYELSFPARPHMSTLHIFQKIFCL